MDTHTEWTNSITLTADVGGKKTLALVHYGHKSGCYNFSHLRWGIPWFFLCDQGSLFFHIPWSVLVQASYLFFICILQPVSFNTPTRVVLVTFGYNRITAWLHNQQWSQIIQSEWYHWRQPAAGKSSWSQEAVDYNTLLQWDLGCFQGHTCPWCPVSI